MPSVAITTGSTAYPLSASDTSTALLTNTDGTDRVLIGLVGVDGLGMSPLHRLSDRSPAQHGVTDRGFRLDPRMISLVLQLMAAPGASYSDLDDGRDTLAQIFVPRDTAMTFTYTKDNGAVRAIACHTAGDLMFGRAAPEGLFQRVAVKLAAPDPLFYDPTQVAVTFGASSAASGMAIPWQIPWKLGATSLNQSRAITYAGTFKTFPVVRITGPVTSPVITNTVTGDKLDFTGTTISSGNYYIIDCENGTVVDQAGANQISKLTTDSDLTTFSLAAHPDAPGGVNTFTVAGTSVSSVTEVHLTYYTRYVSA